MIGMAHTKLKKKIAKKTEERIVLALQPRKMWVPPQVREAPPQINGTLPPMHLPPIIEGPICDHRGMSLRKNNLKNEATFLAKMHYAAEQGDLIMVKKLLRRGVDIDVRGCHLSTPLMSAIMNGRLEMARFLIENGANVNAQNEFGWTPLMKAVLHCNGPMLELLLRHDADVNARNDHDKTALFYALCESGNGLICLLKSLGATE